MSDEDSAAASLALVNSQTRLAAAELRRLSLGRVRERFQIVTHATIMLGVLAAMTAVVATVIVAQQDHSVVVEPFLVPPSLAARGFRVIALDTPGYGASDAPPVKPTMTNYADNLLCVLGALGLEAPHILGHHTGAGIAAIHAARYPDRIAGLILQGVPWFDATTRAHFSPDWFGSFTHRPDGGHLREAWQQRVSVMPGWTDIDAMHRLTVEMLRAGGRYADGFHAALAHDLEADLLAIRAPVLNFINRGDSAFALSEATARLRPDWPFVVHAGGTNDYIDESPDAWTATVANFFSAARFNTADQRLAFAGAA